MEGVGTAATLIKGLVTVHKTLSICDDYSYPSSYLATGSPVTRINLIPLRCRGIELVCQLFYNCLVALYISARYPDAKTVRDDPAYSSMIVGINFSGNPTSTHRALILTSSFLGPLTPHRSSDTLPIHPNSHPSD
ncbi:unnamed protein product [Rodentolepis nana]|uniref:Uncharacterized protein n=1 Tax=Rodentolepis nana TaxID=102285 RepID=A0A0R3TZW9_RODNA|nr:unnamed protein product [Rodentolepis nana]